MPRLHVQALAAVLLALPFAAAAKPGALSPPASRCEQPAAHAAPLPALRIEVCERCGLGREEIAAIERAYAVAAHVAGYRIDALATTQVRIVETGRLENDTPYASGETMGMRFRVGDPHAGETLGSVVGRMVFLIVSGAL